VEIYQSSRDSSDLSFDLALTGTEALLAPAVLGQPGSQVVEMGGTAVFSIDAIGTAPLNYQWRIYDAPVPNATGPVLVITNASAGNAGLYRALISNKAGSVVSAAATLSTTNSLPAPGHYQLSIGAVTAGYRIRYRGDPGFTCELQRSEDLAHWSTLTETTIPADGIAEYLEPNPPPAGIYYRARQH
jgi:hypothetical protein